MRYGHVTKCTMHEPLRTTLIPSLRFRVSKILIYVSADYNKLHDEVCPLNINRFDNHVHIWIWTVYGLDMDCIWTGYGLDMDWTWTVYGLDIDWILTLYGLFMD